MGSTIENPEVETPASVAAATDDTAEPPREREDLDCGDDIDGSDAGGYNNNKNNSDTADDDYFTRRHAPQEASSGGIERGRHHDLDDEHRRPPTEAIGESSPPTQTGAAMYAETAAPKPWALAEKLPYIHSSDGSSLRSRLGHGPSGSGVGRCRMFHYQRLLNCGALTAPPALARRSGDNGSRRKGSSGGITTAPAKLTAAAAGAGRVTILSREWSLLRNTKVATRARTNVVMRGSSNIRGKHGQQWTQLKSAQNVSQVLMRAARQGSFDSDESSDAPSSSAGDKGSKCLSSIWSDGSDDMLSDSSWSGQSLEEASATG